MYPRCVFIFKFLLFAGEGNILPQGGIREKNAGVKASHINGIWKPCVVIPCG